jgi:hypothetical protein
MEIAFKMAIAIGAAAVTGTTVALLGLAVHPSYVLLASAGSAVFGIVFALAAPVLLATTSQVKVTVKASIPKAQSENVEEDVNDFELRFKVLNPFHKDGWLRQTDPFDE